MRRKRNGNVDVVDFGRTTSVRDAEGVTIVIERGDLFGVVRLTKDQATAIAEGTREEANDGSR